uniref:Uncharacterized protein n=1 Tax=Globodera rostochiensis TaxID=31243 RepID=A0A914HAA1_GLORO
MVRRNSLEMNSASSPGTCCAQSSFRSLPVVQNRRSRHQHHPLGEESEQYKQEEEERGRENAYKAVLVLSLCLSLCAWTCILTVCPLLYQLISFTTSQFDGILQFCEDTAQTVATESAGLMEMFSREHQYADNDGVDQSQIGGVNRTRSRNFRHVLPLHFQHQLQEQENGCRCAPEPGPQGTPGRMGMKGTPGAKGGPGLPARLPCEPLQDLKKFCPEKCPQGLQGQSGFRGSHGEKGRPGPIGLSGKNGEDGKTGPRGMPGPPGVPGLDGEDGESGTDAQPMPFVPGPPGPGGEIGDSGPPGPRGLPGIDGTQGPQGRKGAQGNAGKMGTSGTPGPTGPIGEPGEDGHKGVCPTYCAMDGGVFFVEPPEWFFKNSQKKRK